MSCSAAPTMMTAFGLYQEDANEESFVETDRMPLRFPLLEGNNGEPAEEAAVNASVMEVVTMLREDAGSADAVEVDTIRWRGQRKEAIVAQLQPLLLHYRIQILLVRERTHRRALEMSETNERVPLVTEYYKETPVKWRLLGYMGGTNAMLLNADSESLCRTPASTITALSEVRREQQFRESFHRLEETVLRHGGGSYASSPARYSESGLRSPSGRNSGAYPPHPFSPAPVAPPGVRAREAGSLQSDAESFEEAAEAFDSTVAFVDKARHR